MSSYARDLFSGEKVEVGGKAPAKTSRTPARQHHRRRAWEDHANPAIFVTDLVEPPTPLSDVAMPASVEVEAGRAASLDALLTDDKLAELRAAVRAARVAEYERRYATGLALYHPDDHAEPVDYPGVIANIGRAVREEALAEQGLRHLAHGVYPVRDPKIDPTTPYRCQPWIPARPGFGAVPARKGVHVNIKGPGGDRSKGGLSSHIKDEASAWKALADYYAEVEGIEVDIDPEPGSPMLELLKLVKEATAAAANARAAGEVMPTGNAERRVKGSGARGVRKPAAQPVRP